MLIVLFTMPRRRSFSQNYSAFARMTDFCETRVPSEIRDALVPIMSDDEAVKDYGVDLGIRMCKALMEAGAPGKATDSARFGAVGFGSVPFVSFRFGFVSVWFGSVRLGWIRLGSFG